MCHVYGDERFERLAQISNGQIYILRKSREYRTGRLTFRKTRPTPVPIGIRRKPRPDGQPGFLRVDTVHLGDRGGNKGIYLVNIVDEVTQFQHLGAVPRITQHFMVLVLKDLISAFPFTVQAFHADNGSEYINHQVAELLNELHIPTNAQIPAPPLERQRARRVQERLHRPQVARPHPRPPRPRPPGQRLPTTTTSAPSSISTGPASSPPRSPAPTAASRDATGRKTSPHPTSGSNPCPAPKTSSGPASPSTRSTGWPAAATHLDAAKAVQRARDELFRAVGQARDSAA